MAERLFLFTQLELPWELGPPDGRYLVRSEPDGEPEWVVVLGTLGAARAQAGRRQVRAARRGSVPPAPEPAPVATTRATVIDPASLPAERQAQAWLSELDAEREIESAVTVLNRVLHSFRIAAANPYVHEVSADQALVIRAGFGEGEQVADGKWLHARELPWTTAGRRSLIPRRRRVRDAALRPQERLAEMLGARERGLVCEELALRARLDLDQGRIAHAAVGLDARAEGRRVRAARGGTRGPRVARRRAGEAARGRGAARAGGPSRASRGR